MATDHRRRLGRRAESIAAWRLWWRGYRILARNWTTTVVRTTGEIDLVARHRGQLVVVEVKCRIVAATHDGALRPEDQVDRGKQQKLSRLLDAWRSTHRAWDTPCRFDVVGVVMSERGRVREFRVWEDAFEYIDA